MKLLDPRRRMRAVSSLITAALLMILLGGCSGSTGTTAIESPSTAAPVAASTPDSSPSPIPTAEPVATATPEPSLEPVVVNVAGVVSPPNNSAYRIEIPRLGINLPIAEGDVPRDVDRAQTPENYAFHLPGTSLFGPGNTYIYAHARVGMFLSLWNARVGDVVVVRTPNGPRNYVVEEIHPRVPPTEISWAGPTQDTRLTLQTSTGPYGTDPRFVVVARPR